LLDALVTVFTVTVSEPTSCVRAVLIRIAETVLGGGEREIPLPFLFYSHLSSINQYDNSSTLLISTFSFAHCVLFRQPSTGGTFFLYFVFIVATFTFKL